MIEYDRNLITKTFLVKRCFSSDAYVFQMEILCFSDSRKYLKWKNINGQIMWDPCEDFDIVDTVSEWRDDVNYLIMQDLSKKIENDE